MSTSSSQPRDRYAVIGNPIAHSKSPAIHARFAEQTGEAVEYGRLLAPVDGFVPHVRAFIDAGRGMNVTVPFKLDAHALHAPVGACGGGGRGQYAEVRCVGCVWR